MCLRGFCQKSAYCCSLLSFHRKIPTLQPVIMALPRQTLNDLNSRNVQVLPLDSLEQDGSNSECRTQLRLEVNNFEEQYDVPKSPALDSTTTVTSFARSHHNTFHNSTINTIGGDQINFTDSEGAGLRLLYQEIAQVGAFYDSEDRFPPPRCHPQTREAVLADISAWIRKQNCDASTLRNSNRDSVRSSQRLVHWLYGPAGVGKSAIAQTLAESFKGSHLAASFFFSRSSSKRNNPRTLFATVAYCLAVSGDTKLRAAIDKVIREHPALLGASIELQFLELVVKPLESQRLPRERWRNLPKVVIIDGLDECQGSDSQRRVLTTILSQLVDEKGRPRYRIPLRFLIASRPEPQIRDIFNKSGYLDITTRIELGDNHSTSRDIERYLRDSFHEIARTSDVMRSVPRPWPSQGVIDNLVQRASGQFIYASTLIKYVSDEYSHPVERLELALGLPIGDPDAFSDLDLLYRQIMSSSRNRPRLLQILGAFYCLQEMPETPGLTYPRSHPRESIGLMENILLLSPGAISLALRNLHSVLEINQDSFHFRHKSFTDFLLDKRRSGEFFLDLSLYHELITRCCMKIANEAQTDILQPIQSRQLRYAKDNFIYHLECSKVTVPLIDDLKDFNCLSCFRSGMPGRLDLQYDTDGISRWLAESDCHFYLRRVIMKCYKYFEILTEKFRDSLQQPTSNPKRGFYASGIRKNYLHFISEISELEVLFTFLLPDRGTYENPYISTLELVYDLHPDNLSDLFAEISICHPYFYPPAFNPDSGDWYFIDFSRGHSSLAKCYSKRIRLDRNSSFWAGWSWSHNFRCSAHELSLVEELVKTIEFLPGYELLEAINWLQRYPDKCHIVNNAIDKCTKRIKILRSPYPPTIRWLA
ncbi:hypothetical protein K435DRAFT_971396 [Dendrothele bispora CBS 962.96]|uniref:NACHT domain-containing protein n=1 Tax=Dendrothele bispora (strain CBS 962.96) TaxID=1314807 RepID=A0A4S8L5J7_DENBC|nr:hypothetical protein K435DRAFT_971396 [Dendrothele bispora CBS 962.96]